MASSSAARVSIHRTPIRRRRVAGLLAVIVVAAALGDQVLASPSPTAPAREHGGPAAESTTAGALGEAGGAVPDGTTIFDTGVPGVANLDPALLGALRRATTDAADEGVELLVDSGWRSAAYQQRLLDEAVARYGSVREAARWVAPPERSAHVSGEAVDIGPAAAAAWLSQRGAAYGLCQVYENEPWHYELRPGAADRGCPSMYPDPTHDPRLQP